MTFAEWVLDWPWWAKLIALIYVAAGLWIVREIHIAPRLNEPDEELPPATHARRRAPWHW